jgi:hypothetical protein
MAKCRKFESKDLSIINCWYRERGSAQLTEDAIPSLGFIVDDIGAGFIYQTDSCLCFIEGYVANPATSKEDRKEAFDIITANLIMAAKEAGYTKILAFTEHPEIKKRCLRYDFKHKGVYDLYVREV